jgi:hypothetical protein
MTTPIGALLGGQYSQTPASSSGALDAGGSSFADAMSAVDKFMKYQNMTPAEKIRASYLAAKGLTEDDLKAMGPEERKKIEDEIAQKIRETMQAKASKTLTGSAV